MLTRKTDFMHSAPSKHVQPRNVQHAVAKPPLRVVILSVRGFMGKKQNGGGLAIKWSAFIAVEVQN